jgi:hypothetical protein
MDPINLNLIKEDMASQEEGSVSLGEDSAFQEEVLDSREEDLDFQEEDLTFKDNKDNKANKGITRGILPIRVKEVTKGSKSSSNKEHTALALEVIQDRAINFDRG